MPMAPNSDLRADDDNYDDEEDDDIPEDDEEDEDEQDDSQNGSEHQKTLTGGANRKRLLDPHQPHQNDPESELDEFLITTKKTDDYESSDGELNELPANPKQPKVNNDVLFFLEPVSVIKKERREEDYQINSVDSNSHLISGAFLNKDQIQSCFQSNSLSIEPMQIKTDFTCTVNNQDSPRYLELDEFRK
jgi:hypothetical protein